MSVDLREALEEHRRGNLERASRLYQKALAEDPNHLDVLNLHANLAIVLVQRGELEAAIGHFRAVIRLKPDLAWVHHDLGTILQSLGRLEEARDAFLEAQRLEPERAATHAAIAHVWEQLGEFEHASRSLRETLRRDSTHAWALARLATRQRGKLPAADQATIERLLADRELPRESRIQLLYGLAQVFDDRGNFDRAADLSIQANSLQLKELQERGRVYDHQGHRRLVDRLIADFSPAFFDRVRGFGLETQRPVFIVGLPRSGTSLTEQILASHPRVFGAGELKLARHMFETLPGAGCQGGMPFDFLPSLDQKTTRDLARRYLIELAKVNDTADRVVDKMPDNTVYLGLIATVFPDAQLILCRRDVRDVALSCWMTNFMQVSWACDPDQIAMRIEEHQRLMEHWRLALPAPIFEVDYEKLVSEVETGAKAIVAQCGLEWDPACLEFHKTKRPVRTSSLEQVRQPAYTSSVGRWRNYERQLAPLFAKLTARP